MDPTVMVTVAALVLVGALLAAAVWWSRSRDSEKTNADAFSEAASQDSERDQWPAPAHELLDSPQSGDDEDVCTIRALREHVLVLEQALTDLAEETVPPETAPGVSPSGGSQQAREEYARRVATTIRVVQARIPAEEGSASALARVAAAIARLDAADAFARPSWSVTDPEPALHASRAPAIDVFQDRPVEMAPVEMAPVQLAPAQMAPGDMSAAEIPGVQRPLLEDPTAEDRAVGHDGTPIPDSTIVLPVPPPDVQPPPPTRRWRRRSAA